ncbi:MAG TPA: hypothetical protein VNM22_04845 [Candidatus Limnocylindrales bacterium]|nr:hypothetical protein [Candidatus Limnocylindrales bacterium]
MKLFNPFINLIFSVLLGIFLYRLFPPSQNLAFQNFLPVPAAYLYAVWIPLVYLTFLFFYEWLFRIRTRQEIKGTARKVDLFTYPFALAFLALEFFWERLRDFNFWFELFLLSLIFIKGIFLSYFSLKLFTLDQRVSSNLEKPDLDLRKLILFLFFLNLGGYILLVPLTQTSPYPFTWVGGFFIKTLLIACLTPGVFLLSLSLSGSLTASFLVWLSVTFNFPLVQIPLRFTPLWLGWVTLGGAYLLGYLLRVGKWWVLEKLAQTSIESRAILFALMMVLLGLAFKTIVPNPTFHPPSFLEGVFALLLDRQLGLFSYAPLYLLAFLGAGVLLREGLNKKFLVLTPALFAYLLLCLIRYGFPASPFSSELVRPFDPEDIIPLLPALGGFMALFFGRMFGKKDGSSFHSPIPFSFGPVLIVFLVNLSLVISLLLGYCNIPSLIGKFRNFQVDLAENLGREILFFYPTLASESFWPSWGVWVPVFGFLICLGYLIPPLLAWEGGSKRVRRIGIGILFLLIPLFLFIKAPRRYSVPGIPPFYLSLNKPAWEIKLEEDSIPLTRSLILVSSLANSVGFPQSNAIAFLTLSSDKEEIQSFPILVGEHTSEWAFGNPDIQPFLAHNRAMIYTAWVTHIRKGPWFESYNYYAQFDLEKPMKIKKISLYRTLPLDFKLADSVLRVEKLILLYAGDGGMTDKEPPEPAKLSSLSESLADILK